MSKLRKFRKMTWVLWAWCVLILVWAVSTASSTDEACTPGDEFSEACEAGAAVGAGLGVALILFIGFVGFVFFSIIWLMTRPKHRTCQRCGEDVRKGRTECPSCGQPMGQPVATTA